MTSLKLSVAKGFIEGERIAKLSMVTLICIGLVEILVGQVAHSISLTADGVDSISDAAISMIVWLGLRFSRRVQIKNSHLAILKWRV